MATADKTIRWPDDSTRVNVNDQREVEFWARRFRCSLGKLKQAIRAVGTRYIDVEHHLNDRRYG